MQDLDAQNIGSILDFAMEGAGDDEKDYDDTAKNIMDTLSIAEKNQAGMGCLKVTGMASSSVLRQVSAHIRYQRNNPNHPLPSLYPLPPSPYHPSSRRDPLAPTQAPPPLTAHAMESLSLLEARLDRIMELAHAKNVNILVDAEETWLQPAIDYLIHKSMRKWNLNRPVVYQTIQFYLKDSNPQLLAELKGAEEEGFYYGVKCVRGAYMHAERKVASSVGYPSPIHDTLADSHASYDNAIAHLLTKTHADVLVASHNYNSAVRATNILRELGETEKGNNRRVTFGQLLGMSDFITNSLAQQGFLSVKYVPLGPIDAVIPYLIRRAAENRDLLGATSIERDLLWRESVARLVGLRR